jgi:hypothetical protein
MNFHLIICLKDIQLIKVLLQFYNNRIAIIFFQIASYLFLVMLTYQFF